MLVCLFVFNWYQNRKLLWNFLPLSCKHCLVWALDASKAADFGVQLSPPRTQWVAPVWIPSLAHLVRVTCAGLSTGPESSEERSLSSVLTSSPNSLKPIKAFCRPPRGNVQVQCGSRLNRAIKSTSAPAQNFKNVNILHVSKRVIYETICLSTPGGHSVLFCWNTVYL